MKIAILDDWFDTLKTLPSFAALNQHDVTVFTDHIEDTNQLAKRLIDFDCLVLFRERTAISKSLIEKLPNLKLISQRGQYPHVDVAACTQHNVLLCSKQAKGNSKPSYATIEHTWALILASYRQIPQQVQSLKAGHWQMGVGRSLHSRTLGLYGYGSIAKGVAEIAEAFGMQVLWWGSENGRQRLQADKKNIAPSRQAFFATADIVSLHIRLNAETKGIITAEDLAQMQERALLVNTSRAGIIETGALLTALNQHHPGYAAIDVFEKEPITWANDALASHPNMLATPHIGFVTEDELDVQFADIYQQINAYTEQNPVNMINPKVWENQK